LTIISSAAIKGGPHQQHMPHCWPTKIDEPSDKTKGQSRDTSITWFRKTAEQSNRREIEGREEGGQNKCK